MGIKLSELKDPKLRDKVAALDAEQNAKQLGITAGSEREKQQLVTRLAEYAVKKGFTKRLRQSEKPLMNKLETQYFDVLKRLHPGKKIHAQDKTYRLANGLRYTPDFTALLIDENGNAREHAWECKGKWVDGDSFPKLKMFAAVWPEIVLTLAWKEGNCWREQRILA